MSNTEPRRIETIVNPDGTTRTEYYGFIGKECMVTEERLRAAMARHGIQIKDSEFQAKPELSIEAQTQTQQSRDSHQL